MYSDCTIIQSIDTTNQHKTEEADMTKQDFQAIWEMIFDEYGEDYTMILTTANGNKYELVGEYIDTLNSENFLTVDNGEELLFIAYSQIESIRA